METYINPNPRSEYKMKKRILQEGKKPMINRSLIHKKFVNYQTLILVFSLSLFYLVFHTFLMAGKPLILIIVVEIVMFFLVWNKAYQMLYDLKLLFFFNNDYDNNIRFPADTAYPAITFIIPSFHEPFKVAKMTFDSVVHSPYRGRKEIIVVDNSRDIESDDFKMFKTYVEEFNLHRPDISARFIHNKNGETLKPGNLDLAEKFIEEGEFVVILDVDSTLPVNGNLLEKAVTEFILDNHLGFLQFCMKATNHHFNDLTQCIAASQDLHRLRLTSRSYGGYKIFEGHNGMWRRTVLEKIGAWTDYYKGNIMITEDILKSAQVYANGYYGKSLNVKTGEWVPSSLNALESMWMRWTYGTSQVLFKYFGELYSKQVSLLEKFDISYHVLHHFAHGFILPVAIFLQLFMPGMIANLFIFSVYILPQVIGGVTIYFRSVSKLDIPLNKKIWYVYSGFFLIDTFIMSTQLKSIINFLAGLPQGWKVTEKGVENSLKWKDLLMNKSFHIVLSIIAFIVFMVSWKLNFNLEPSRFVDFIFLNYMIVNLLLCIVVFGKEGRRKHNDVESSAIDSLKFVPVEIPEIEVNPLLS